MQTSSCMGTAVRWPTLWLRPTGPPRSWCGSPVRRWVLRPAPSKRRREMSAWWSWRTLARRWNWRINKPVLQCVLLLSQPCSASLTLLLLISGEIQQGWHSEDEPTQIQQGGGHGGAHLPERGLCAAQPQGEILLRTHLCEWAGICFCCILMSPIFPKSMLLLLLVDWLVSCCLSRRRTPAFSALWSTRTNTCPSTARRSWTCTRARRGTRCPLTSTPSQTQPTGAWCRVRQL